MGDLPVIQAKIIECGNNFDTYKGEKIKARLKQYNVPYTGHTLFSGMFAYGLQWAAEYFTNNGYFNNGGWIWSENSINIWAPKVNEDLFKKRELEMASRLRITHSSKAQPPTDIVNEQYFTLPGGIFARHGDIVKVQIFDDSGFRSQNYTAYGLVHFSQQYGGYNNDRWVFDWVGYYYEYYRDKLRGLSLHYLFDKGVLVDPSEGYCNLVDGYKREWRKIHGVKGRPKFNQTSSTIGKSLGSQPG